MPKVPWVSEGAEKVIADWEKVTGKVRQGTDANKQFTRAQQELDQVTRRMLRETETGQERVNRKLDEAKRLHIAGKLSVQELNQVTSRLTVTNERTFGRSAVTKLGSFAAGYVSVGAAIGLVSRALQTAEQDAQRAADTIANSLQQFGELQQLGGDFTKNKEFALSLLQRGAITEGELGQAANISFALTSAGFTDPEKEVLARAAESQFVSVPKLAEFGGGLRKYQRTFGEAETGDLEAVFRKAIAASEVAQSDIPTILTASTQFGGEAKAGGLSDEEAMAAFLAIEQRAPNPKVASTRMRSLLNEIQKRGLGKGSFQETLSGIDARISSGETAFDVLGESRAVSGFRNIMEGRQFVGEQTEALRQAQGIDLIGQRAEGVRQDPELGPALSRRRAEGGLAFGRIMRDSARENLFDTIRAEQVNKLESGNFIDRMMQYPVRAMYGVNDFLDREGGIIREASAGNVPGQSADTQRQAQEYLRRMAESSEQQVRILEDQSRNGNLGRQE
jgi:hypothetical protein